MAPHLYTFDHDTHSQAIKAGIKRAKRRGGRQGPPKTLKYAQRDLIRRSIAAGRLTVTEAALLWNLSDTTIRRYVKEGS